MLSYLAINFYLPHPFSLFIPKKRSLCKLNLIKMDIKPKQLVYGFIFLCLLSGFGFQVLSVFWYHINFLKCDRIFRWKKVFANSSKAKQQLQSICTMLNYLNCQRLAFVLGSKMEDLSRFESQKEIWPFYHTSTLTMLNLVTFKGQKSNTWKTD